MKKLSDITRPDQSKFYLSSFQNDGYEQVVFVANVVADPQCEVLNGNIYLISELIGLDNPLYRISHPNCNCEFKPYGKQITQTAVPEPEEKEVEVPIVPTQTTQPTQPPANPLSSRE